MLWYRDAGDEFRGLYLYYVTLLQKLVTVLKSAHCDIFFPTDGREGFEGKRTFSVFINAPRMLAVILYNYPW